MPSLAAAVSERIPREDQSKCQSIIFALGSVGAWSGIFGFNGVLFSATDHGLGRSKCPLAGLLLSSLCVLFTALAARRAGQGGAADPTAADVKDDDLEKLRVPPL